MAFQLTVNGRSRSIDVPGDMPLLWVLRDVMALRGTKFGCGIGQCGACTVHVSGKAVRSCQMPVSAAAGAPITTIEGLSQDGTHPLQLAWKEIDVPQCGYCQTGQIMSASALLSRKPNPTDDDIDAAMNGNICRCGTYLRIRQAIHRAASIGRPDGLPNRPIDTAVNQHP
jgi:isoquinoline 1-oxidoreductase subunit alpha